MADDLLVLGDIADIPSPLLDFVSWRPALRDSSVAVVQARPLPLSRHGDGDPGTHGLCVMTRGRDADALGDFAISASHEDPRQLLDRAQGQGLRVTAETAGAVFSRARWDGDQQQARASTEPGYADWHAPADSDAHPASLASTSLGQLLRATGVEAPVRATTGDPAQCFLTVITRTQGTRSQCLEDMLTCLAGQTVRDFEVIIARHRVAEDQRSETADVVARSPGWLQERIRIIDVDRPGRAAPLNDALDVANGRYAAVLDDDDLVLAHWVESFLELDARAPGRVLRTVALRQDVTPMQIDGHLVASEVGTPLREWPLTFELVDHLRANYTPCMTVAFPRGVFRTLGHRFNEELQTTEDWEYLVRAASVVGAESLPTVTSVYRWWLDEASSRAVHAPEDWEQSRELVLRAVDDQVILLPRGSARRVRALIDEVWEAHGVLMTEYRRTSGVYLQLVDTHQQTVARAQQAEAKVKDLRTRLAKRRRQAERRLARIQELEALLGDDAPLEGTARKSRRGVVGRMGQRRGKSLKS